MTILEAIQSVLAEYPNGLICKDITAKILEKKLYSFNAKNPNAIVNHELRRHCEGLTFPAAHPLKHFTIVPGLPPGLRPGNRIQRGQRNASHQRRL